MAEGYVCWNCGAPLDELSLPLTRLDACPHCRAELHVCRMCLHFEPRWRQGCREERAEDVSERERANFCDYFSPRAGAFQARSAAAADSARAELEALFGDAPRPATGEAAEAEQSRKALDDLFKKG